MPQRTSADTVLFDVDGTLIDSTYHHTLAWARAFGRFDLNPPLWRVHRSIGMGGDQLVPSIVGDEVESSSGDDLREQWGIEYTKILDEVRAFSGAAEAIRELRKAGYRVAIASSGKPEFTDKAMQLMGLSADEVDAVVSAEDADASKPEPDILHAALSQAGGQRGILVGDAVWDVVAAKNAGMECIGVRTGGFSAAELEGEGAVAVVDSIENLQEHELFTGQNR